MDFPFRLQPAAATAQEGAARVAARVARAARAARLQG